MGNPLYVEMFDEGRVVLKSSHYDGTHCDEIMVMVILYEGEDTKLGTPLQFINTYSVLIRVWRGRRMRHKLLDLLVLWALCMR